MKKNEIFEDLEKIDEPKDFTKILSNLHYTHFFLMDKYKKILTDYDLSSPQLNILAIIGHFGPDPLSLEQIKEMVLEPNADVSRIVGRLVEKNYVAKIPNEKNRRKVAIALTLEGTKVYKKLISEKKFYKFTSSLSLSEAKAFTSILAKLRNS